MLLLVPLDFCKRNSSFALTCCLLLITLQCKVSVGVCTTSSVSPVQRVTCDVLIRCAVLGAVVWPQSWESVCGRESIFEH